MSNRRPDRCRHFLLSSTDMPLVGCRLLKHVSVEDLTLRNVHMADHCMDRNAGEALEQNEQKGTGIAPGAIAVGLSLQIVTFS